MNRLATKNLSIILPMLLATVALVASPRPAPAHVTLGSPNGGETLNGSSTSMIEWMPAVAMHDTLNFDLWYSVVGDSGPWTVIALDLPPGDLAVGSFHSYSWAVPNITDSSAWVRVRQENDVNQDYEDVSDGSFSLTAAPNQGDYNGSGTVDVADYTVWRDSLGQQGAGLAADGDGNGSISDGDYAVWKSNFGDTAGAGSAGLTASAVPEPSAMLLCLLGIVGMSFRRANRSLRLRTVAR
jgi:hypothetical protein